MFSFNHPYQTFQVSDQQGLQSYYPDPQQGLQSYYPDPQQGLQRYYPNLQQGLQRYYPNLQQGPQRYYPNPPQHLQSCDYCTADSYLRPFQGYVQSQSDVQLMRRTEHERSQEFEFAIHGGFVNPFHPESQLACFTQRAVDKTSAIHTLIQQINLKMGRNDEKEGVNGNLEKFICFLKICKIKNDSILVHGSGLRFLCSKVNDIDVVIVSNQP